jgi:16S rRNA processing protein RimM
VKTPEVPTDLFAVGRVTGWWGRRGMVKVYPLTDFPDRLPEKGAVWLWREDTGRRLFTVREGRVQGGMVILGFDGVDDISTAETLTGSLVMVEEEGLEKLPNGSWYRHEILGADVVDEAGVALGKLADILETGANDVWVVRGPDGELLIPAVREYVRDVDAAARRVTVRRPVEGSGGPA